MEECYLCFLWELDSTASPHLAGWLECCGFLWDILLLFLVSILVSVSTANACNFYMNIHDGLCVLLVCICWMCTGHECLEEDSCWEEPHLDHTPLPTPSIPVWVSTYIISITLSKQRLTLWWIEVLSSMCDELKTEFAFINGSGYLH